ncbi:MAG TPA: PQQ-dependent sugar dehydrogenase [Candidatus Acidoferrum sp.]|nr:PQQ-dependent sugar dehydrogenase [Candidatus Acidoferrum sp.]
MKIRWSTNLVLLCGFTLCPRPAGAQYPSGPQITKDGTAVLLEDYASAPLSSRGGSLANPTATINFGDQLARLNFLRSEPAGAPGASTRFFVCDQNRNLYIFNRSNQTFTAYINFQAVFPKFYNASGYAAGLVTVQFDPAYATNGCFYTVHVEDPTMGGSAAPTNAALPGLNLAGYAVTPAVNPPAGGVTWEAVLVEWKDTNINDAVFQGTAREILRVGFTSNFHPLGDLLFNPLARPGDADYRNLYLSNGDGGAGEAAGATRTIPQRLDALQGKILRITPDLDLRPSDELGANGRYRIPTNGPDPNPFAFLNLPNLKPEIYAYGFRNCHRLSWDPVSNLLIENDIGLYSWEEVNLIHKGADYGYSAREGNEQLFVGGTNDGKTGSQTTPPTPFPSPDVLTVTGLVSAVTPVYPVTQYSHRDGDSISSGFVYRGRLIPALQGKYIFGDITTGRLFYCDLADMMAADDGNRLTLATVHELQVVFNGVKRRVFDIASNRYHQRGGTSGNALPGGCGGLNTGGNDPYGVPYGCGRADIRLAQDGDGELYLLSKSDGMIRRLTAALIPPTIQGAGVTNSVFTATWLAISNNTYRLQFKNSLTDMTWSNVPGDVIATGPVAWKTDTITTTTRYYRLLAFP